jgi:hypothetical protein
MLAQHMHKVGSATMGPGLYGRVCSCRSAAGVFVGTPFLLRFTVMLAVGLAVSACTCILVALFIVHSTQCCQPGSVGLLAGCPEGYAVYVKAKSKRHSC